MIDWIKNKIKNEYKKGFWEKNFGIRPEKVNSEEVHLMTATWEELLGEDYDKD